MKKKAKPQIETAGDGQGSRQTDLAEGELNTVEESIRIHEEKHDVEGQPEEKK